MSREAIDNDDNNDPPSNGEEEKVSLLVENKQSEEQLPIGQDFETEVLKKKMMNKHLHYQLSRRKVEQCQGQK